MRPTWDEYFLLLAFTIALRSTCKQAKHGSILTYNNQIIATGYNGSPKGEPHCSDIGCKMINNHCLRCRHAEINAILQGLKVRDNLSEATLYVTGTPCLDCTKSIIREGIKKVVYGRGYGNIDQSIELFRKANVSSNYIDINNLTYLYKLENLGTKIKGDTIV